VSATYSACAACSVSPWGVLNCTVSAKPSLAPLCAHVPYSVVVQPVHHTPPSVSQAARSSSPRASCMHGAFASSRHRDTLRLSPVSHICIVPAVGSIPVVPLRPSSPRGAARLSPWLQGFPADVALPGHPVTLGAHKHPLCSNGCASWRLVAAPLSFAPQAAVLQQRCIARDANCGDCRSPPAGVRTADPTAVVAVDAHVGQAYRPWPMLHTAGTQQARPICNCPGSGAVGTVTTHLRLVVHPWAYGLCSQRAYSRSPHEPTACCLGERERCGGACGLRTGRLRHSSGQPQHQ
jgi:hypothetical protein